MQSYFCHGHHVQKAREPAYDTHFLSCNSSAGFDANVGSERSLNTFQLGENVWVEEASVWNFFKRRLSVSLQRLLLLRLKGKKFHPRSFSLPRSLSMFVSFEERQRTCYLHHLQIRLLSISCKHGGWFDCKQPVESKSYKEFKATGFFFLASSLSPFQVCLFLPFKSVSFSLSLPFCLVLMQQTDSFPHL